MVRITTLKVSRSYQLNYEIDNGTGKSPVEFQIR